MPTIFMCFVNEQKCNENLGCINNSLFNCIFQWKRLGGKIYSVPYNYLVSFCFYIPKYKKHSQLYKNTGNNEILLKFVDKLWFMCLFMVLVTTNLDANQRKIIQQNDVELIWKWLMETKVLQKWSNWIILYWYRLLLELPR